MAKKFGKNREHSRMDERIIEYENGLRAEGSFAEKLLITMFLRTPIEGLDDILTKSELRKFRVLLDMTADMIESDRHLA